MTTIIVNGEPRELDPAASGTLLAWLAGGMVVEGLTVRLRSAPAAPA